MNLSLRGTYQAFILILAFSPVVFFFQNCGEGFRAANLSSLDSGSNGIGGVGGDSAIAKIGDLATHRNNTCCGLYDIDHVSGPYVFSRGFRINSATGETVRIAVSNGGPPEFEILNGKLIVYNLETGLPIREFTFAAGREANIRYVSGDRRYIIVMVFGTNIILENQILLIDTVALVVRQIPNASDNDTYVPIENSSKFWHFHQNAALQPVMERFDAANMQVDASLNLAGQIQFDYEVGDYFVISEGYFRFGEAATIRLFNRRDPAAATISVSVPTMPLAAGTPERSIIGYYNGRLIFMDSNLVRSYDPVAGATATILTIPVGTTGPYGQARQYGGLLQITKQPYENLPYYDAYIDLATGVKLYESNVSSSSYLFGDYIIVNGTSNVPASIKNLRNNQQVWSDPSITFVVRTQRIGNTMTIGASVESDKEGGFSIAIIDLAQGKTVHRIYDLVRWGNIVALGNSIAFYSKQVGVPDLYAGPTNLRTSFLSGTRKYSRFKKKVGTVEYALLCDESSGSYDCKIVGVDSATNTYVEYATIPASAYIEEASEDTGGLGFQFRRAVGGVNQLGVFDYATKSLTLLGAADPYIARAGNYAGPTNLGPTSANFTVYDYATKTYRDQVIPVGGLTGAVKVSANKYVYFTETTMGFYDAATNVVSPPVAGGSTNGYFQTKSVGAGYLEIITQSPSASVRFYFVDVGAQYVADTTGSSIISNNWATPLIDAGRFIIVRDNVYDTVTRTLFKLPQPAPNVVYSGLVTAGGSVFAVGGMQSGMALYSGGIGLSQAIYRLDLVNRSATQVTTLGSDYRGIDDFIAVNNSHILFTAARNTNIHRNVVFKYDIAAGTTSAVSFGNAQRCVFSANLGSLAYLLCNASPESPISVFSLDVTK